MFRCRREQPCHVTSVTMDISYPDDDEVQLLVSAMATKMAPSNESPLEQFEVPFEGQQVSVAGGHFCRLEMIQLLLSSGSFHPIPLVGSCGADVI